MKKDKRILALVLAAAMMGTTALPVWAQTPETTDSSVVEVEGTLENIIAAREALAAQPATLAEDDNNIQAAQTMVERVANAVKNHTETAEKVNIKDLNLGKDLVLSTLADLNARVEGGEAISKLSCYYSRDTGLAVAIGLEYCTAQDVAAMQVKLDQLVDQANTLCQTDLEKVFYVHEWLVQNIAYDREHLSDDVQDDHNLRGALLEGSAVCDGYAKTYALTLRKLGITGVLVTSKDIGHAWNMVELDGNWYQVDCTWDDPVDGSDQLGYCMHKHLLCTTEEMNTNHNDDGDDSVAFDLENLGTQNIVNLATDDTYENTWWKDKKSAIFPCGGDWYYASGERLFWRDDLGDCDSNLALEDDSGVIAGSIALDGTLLVATDKQACEQSSWIKQYELDPASHGSDREKEGKSPKHRHCGPVGWHLLCRKPAGIPPGCAPVYQDKGYPSPRSNPDCCTYRNAYCSAYRDPHCSAYCSAYRNTYCNAYCSAYRNAYRSAYRNANRNAYCSAGQADCYTYRYPCETHRNPCQRLYRLENRERQGLLVRKRRKAGHHWPRQGNL